MSLTDDLLVTMKTLATVMSALLAMLVVSVGALAAVLYFGPSGGPEVPSAGQEAAEPETMTVSGTLGLMAGASLDGYGRAAGDECWGMDGFQDIVEGAQVVIRDSTGATLASGSLSGGKRPSGVLRTIQCDFTWEVQGVPKGVGPYSAEVTSRGELTFNEDEATEVAMSLG